MTGLRLALNIGDSDSVPSDGHNPERSDRPRGQTGPALRMVGDRALPITQGNLLDFPADPIETMQKLYAEHGDVAGLEQEGSRIHFVFSPGLNHQVLSDSVTYHSRFFAIRGPRASAQRRLTSGLLSMNGEQHKRNRRMVMDAFLKKTIQGYVPVIKLLAEKMLADWRPGEERDINREMTELLLRLTSTILFGMDNPEMAYRIGRMIDHWVHLNHELGMGAFVSNPEITNRYDDLLAFAGELEAEIVAMIQQRRQSGMGVPDVLSMILAAHDDQGRMTEGELVGQAALIFAAAHLTTAHSLTWTLFLLAQHPQAMRTLHEEFRRNLTGGFPSPEQAERLPYLERVIKESMRILPASSYSQRVTSQPTTLGPFELPAGAGVIFSQFITHHRSDLYPQPEAFLPERWESLSPSPYAYLPFGAGPRMCIGGPLALVIMKSVLPTILQRFKLTSVPYSEVSAKVISTMLSPTTPVPMRLDVQDGAFRAEPVVGTIHRLVSVSAQDQRSRRAA